MEKPKKKKRSTPDVFKRHLQVDEEILWWGQPSPYHLLNGGDLFLIPFSLAWGGFAYFWEYIAITQVRQIGFILWGIPFVIIGSYMMWGRFIHQYWVRRGLYYAITNQRLIMLHTAFGEKINSKPLDKVEIRKQTYGWGGVGTIRFNGFPGTQLESKSAFSHLSGPSFYQIDDPDAVMEILMEVLTRPDVEWSDRLDSEWWDKDKRKNKYDPRF